MDDEKLLPCPFCGSTDLNTKYMNAIYCNNCDGAVELGNHGKKPNNSEMNHGTDGI